MKSKIEKILNDHINKINDSNGTKLTNQLYQIQISLMTFEKNYKELEKSLIDYTNPKISGKLWELGHKDRARLYLWNVSRYLHNFLTSAATFRDHIRYITRKIFLNNSFLDEYDEQIKKTFGDDPLSNFIMKFRNNYLHTTVAGTSASFHLDFPNHKINSQILVNKNQLITHYVEWNKKSREYLDTLPKKIPLIDIVGPYFEKVMEFYKWYENRFFQLFKNDFDELNKLKDDFIVIQRKISTNDI